MINLEKSILYGVIFGPRYQNSILRMEIQIIYRLQLYRKSIRLNLGRYIGILQSSSDADKK